MLIRKAKPSDKSHILNFCNKTFSWGDYIEDVWDYWFSDGNLLVLEKNLPVGICHTVFSNKQVWIEGIRINPDFRRQGLASNLIIQVESLANQNQIPVLLMLIETENSSSLSMAQNLEFKINQTWNFYSLLPKKNTHRNISFEKLSQNSKFSHYVKSWRWLPLTKEKILELNSKNQIIISEIEGEKTIAILEDSEHFKKTLIVTLFAGSKKNSVNVLSFLQNYGWEKNYQRLQILTQETLPKFNNMEKKISFHLMQKLLS